MLPAFRSWGLRRCIDRDRDRADLQTPSRAPQRHLGCWYAGYLALRQTIGEPVPLLPD